MHDERLATVTVELVENGILIVARNMTPPLLRVTKLIDLDDCKAEVLEELRQTVESALAIPRE